MSQDRTNINKFFKITENDTVRISYGFTIVEWDVLLIEETEDGERVISFDVKGRNPCLVTEFDSVYLETKAKQHPPGWTTKTKVEKVEII
jgi:hypothetical protein